MSATAEKYYLFSIDLEDVRDMIPNGYQYKEAVVAPTLLYLDWLKKHNATATFFIVGNTAEKFPDLIREIVKQGHETACHTYDHIHLTKQTPDEFKRDTEKAVNAIMKCGAPKVVGFRAPTFSLVQRTQWAYGILKEFGFTYSSSVLPSANPIFGWSDFGGEKMMDGIYEIPMNIGTAPFKVPFGGGTYFRCLPQPVLNYLFKSAASRNETVLGYFHPYDVNTAQEHFMHPHLNDNKLMNELMYVNRGKVFNRLDAIVERGFKVMRYDEYLKEKTK